MRFLSSCPVCPQRRWRRSRCRLLLIPESGPAAPPPRCPAVPLGSVADGPWHGQWWLCSPSWSRACWLNAGGSYGRGCGGWCEHRGSLWKAWWPDSSGCPLWNCKENNGQKSLVYLSKAHLICTSESAHVKSVKCEGQSVTMPMHKLNIVRRPRIKTFLHDLKILPTQFQKCSSVSFGILAIKDKNINQHITHPLYCLIFNFGNAQVTTSPCMFYWTYPYFMTCRFHSFITSFSPSLTSVNSSSCCK